MGKSGISWKRAVSIPILLGGMYLILTDEPIPGFIFLAVGFGLMAWD